MGLTRVENCLCCSLKTGILIFGWLGIIECVIALVLLVSLWYVDYRSIANAIPELRYISSYQDLKEVMKAVDIFCIIFIIVYIINFVMCIVLIKGVKQV